MCALNDHLCCAERRLLRSALRDARNHSVRGEAVPRWLRRKYGGLVEVVRPVESESGSGLSRGCSVPCILCRRELLRYGFEVRCTTRDGRVWRGRLDQDDAPASKATRGQLAARSS